MARLIGRCVISLVSDTARWLVLEIDGREVRRVPLRLARGDVPTVRG